MKTLFTLLILLAFHLSVSASELFIRINKTGAYYAMVGLQTHYNNSNTFRFFDLPQGINEVKIYYNNTSNIFWSGTISLDYNQRAVCEVDANGNLIVIQRQTMNITNWYTSTPQQGNYGSYNNQYYGNNSPDNSGYYEFIKLLKEESFDSGKLEKAKSYVSKTTLSAAQIAEISGTFSFDSNRLDWAKYAYQYCYDKQNYFLLKPTFSFSSNYTSLEDYINGK
ncbi:MAG: DUF4476 domain-containing protein [Bacteroidota bacterium]